MEENSRNLDCPQTANRAKPEAFWLAKRHSMCDNSHMATNLAIDDRLLNAALKVGGHKTKKETVNEALREYIQRRKQLEILKLSGKVDFDPDYDHKRQRRRP
jgi:Arc/MetJ family transcription regulator